MNTFKENSCSDSNSSTIQFEDLFYHETTKILNNSIFSLPNQNAINLLDNTNNILITSNNFAPNDPETNNLNEIKKLGNSQKSRKKEKKIKYYKNKRTKTMLTLPKNKIGRKRKNDTSIRKHNKYTGDNLRRKCKQIILSNALIFINDKIKQIYNNNIGKGLYRKELLRLNNFQQYDINNNFNKKFLDKKLCAIFSEKVSGKFTNYMPNHNQIIIKRLLEEKDEDKKIFFRKLFNVTFLQCLKKFIGIESIEELDGFKTFNEFKEESTDEPEYIDALRLYCLEFEAKIKNSRKSQSEAKQGKEEL
jgi:hypothetical protein